MHPASEGWQTRAVAAPLLRQHLRSNRPAPPQLLPPLLPLLQQPLRLMAIAPALRLPPPPQLLLPALARETQWGQVQAQAQERLLALQWQLLLVVLQELPVQGQGWTQELWRSRAGQGPLPLVPPVPRV